MLGVPSPTAEHELVQGVRAEGRLGEVSLGTEEERKARQASTELTYPPKQLTLPIWGPQNLGICPHILGKRVHPINHPIPPKV